MLSLLSLLVTFHPVQAQATHCWAVTYSDNGTGTWSYVSPSQTPPAQNGKWTPGSNGCSFGGSDTRNGSIQGTVTLTWVPAAGQTMQSDPSPSTVSIIEYASAYENSLLGTDPNTQGPAGSASDGLGDTSVVYGDGYVSSGYHVLPSQNGSSGSILLSGVTLNAQNPLFSVTSGYPPYTRWPGGQTAVSLSVILPPPLQAHSTVDTANWDELKPRFFSGTNCKVTGTATAYSAPPGNASYPNGGSYVQQASLSIGGKVVKQYYDSSMYGPFTADTILGTNQASVPLSVFFDSTHFADGSNIPAQMTVTDSGGLTYTVNLSGPACNNLVAVANQTSSAVDPATGENVAINAANGQAKGQKGDPNFQPYPGVMTQSSPNNIGAIGIFYHHKSALINDIAASGYTVFFAATHADPGYLGDCYSVSGTDAQGNPNPAYDPGAYLNDTDIQGAITTRTTALSAPYLFVFLHGCDSGGSTSLPSDFGIATISSSDDRAYVGYGAAIIVNQENTNFAVKTWYYLMQGLTVDKATGQASFDFPIQAYSSTGNGGTTGPAVYGDSNMTLHGKVYNWTSGPVWYR